MDVPEIVTIMLAALSLGAALGHLLELPAKMMYEGGLWLTVSRTLYGAFGTIAALRPETLPADWMALRTQWEYTHAARAALQIIALGALVTSVLVETPTRAFGEQPH